MRLPTPITRLLLRCAEGVMAKRNSDIDIGPQGDPYMQRWHAIPRNKLFNVYLHLYHHDDDRILHSHPWWSLSLMLQGGLVEYYTATAEGAADAEKHKIAIVRGGDIRVRSAGMFHRLQVMYPRKTITVFITGPKLKTWHFACPKGLVEWTKFVSTRDRGIPGSGCGEGH
jgi:hypothetical protein